MSAGHAEWVRLREFRKANPGVIIGPEFAEWHADYPAPDGGWSAHAPTLRDLLDKLDLRDLLDKLDEPAAPDG